mmetsp:Transcript_50060/g.152274  ORF Transcript_50060/g.152274 Transcript_50060/m.152274 type:complete len:339 (+) Transcript_50060:82-1098(+)
MGEHREESDEVVRGAWYVPATRRGPREHVAVQQRHNHLQHGREVRLRRLDLRRAHLGADLAVVLQVARHRHGPLVAEGHQGERDADLPSLSRRAERDHGRGPEGVRERRRALAPEAGGHPLHDVAIYELRHAHSGGEIADLLLPVAEDRLQIQEIDIVDVDVVAEGLQADRRCQRCPCSLAEQLQKAHGAARSDVELLSSLVRQCLRQLRKHPRDGRGKHQRRDQERPRAAQLGADERPDGAAQAEELLRPGQLLRQLLARAVHVGQRGVHRAREAEDHRAADHAVDERDGQTRREEGDQCVQEGVHGRREQHERLPAVLVRQAPEERIEEELQRRGA